MNSDVATRVEYRESLRVLAAIAMLASLSSSHPAPLFLPLLLLPILFLLPLLLLPLLNLVILSEVHPPPLLVCKLQAATFRANVFPVPLREKNTFLDFDVPEAGFDGDRPRPGRSGGGGGGARAVIGGGGTAIAAAKAGGRGGIVCKKTSVT